MRCGRVRIEFRELWDEIRGRGGLFNVTYLFSLRHEQEDQAKRDEIEASVEAEGTGRRHDSQHTRERNGQHGSPEETGSDGPGHADLAVRKPATRSVLGLDRGFDKDGLREDFRTVSERNGTFARRVEGCEQVDEQCYQSQMR